MGFPVMTIEERISLPLLLHVIFLFSLPLVHKGGKRGEFKLKGHRETKKLYKNLNHSLLYLKLCFSL